MNTKCPGSVCRDDLAYAEISSHWFLTSMMMGTKGYWVPVQLECGIAGR
jgi:hypothetical protein